MLENLKTTHTSSSNIYSLKLVDKTFKVLVWSLLDLVRRQGLLKVLDDLGHVDLCDKPFIVLAGEVKAAGRIFVFKVVDQFIAICYLRATGLVNKIDSSLQGVFDIALGKT